ncbi:MAG: exodeoxyribonuclease VII small subunit [Methanomethylophilus sp.]|jgi:exodeoxyribonuclease VII small subunit
MTDEEKMREEIAKMSFEDSMKELEDLVKQLESGELDLDKSLEVYERATALRDHCRQILDESDRRVQKIMQNGQKEDFEEEQ